MRVDLDAAECPVELFQRIGAIMTYDGLRTAMAYAFETNASLFDVTSWVATDPDHTKLNNKWKAIEEALVVDHLTLARTSATTPISLAAQEP